MNRVGQAWGAVRERAAGAARSAVGRSSIPFWSAGGALAILLVSVVALGGLDRAEAAPVQYDVGDEARLSLFSITVLDARLADEIEEESVSADEGEVLVVVTARMENLAEYPVGVGRAVDRVASRLVGVTEPLLSLSGVTPTSSPYVWRTDDSAGSVILQPRVPTEVQVVWPVPEDAITAGVLTLDVHDADARRGQIILSSDHITWRRADLAAQFTLDVGEAP